MSTKKKTIKKAPHRPHGLATAAAILGHPTVKVKKNGEVRIKPQWAKYYQRLMELREQLSRQMDGLAKESAQEMAGYSLHMADSGTDNFDRDFALSLLSSDQDAIYEIEEALKRIEKNTYGVCELTGKAIPEVTPGSDSVDALYGGSSGPAGARGRLAATSSGRARHRGCCWHYGSRARRRRSGREN